ncbi:MAG: response regulator, partial [Desulfobulbaceae bacterium]|nr:response regulator [Desulfobulbaceae bacterium]
MIEDTHFDIVISDILMPEMDGITLLEKIKDYNGMIQVVMMTQEISINNTIKAFRKGAVDIFFKPFENLNQISETIDQIAAKLDRVNAILKRLVQEKKNND